MELHYTSRNFASHFGPALQGPRLFNFSIQELLWAAITVGRPSFIDVISNGVYSKYEILYRASIVAANLAIRGEKLGKSPAYEALDPSEKSAVSYFLGLTVTKLLSGGVLNLPWLVHIDVYRDRFTRAGHPLTFGPTKQRPDLIGLSNDRDWIVFESKGRTNGMDPTLLAKAKAQTRNLYSVGGRAPILRVAVATFFKRGNIMVEWEDPEEANQNGYELKITAGEYLRDYYQLVYNTLAHNETSQVDRYIVHRFDAVDLVVGMHQSIYNACRSNRPEALSSKDFHGQRDQLKGVLEDGNYFGPDGILIGTGRNWGKWLR